MAIYYSSNVDFFCSQLTTTIHDNPCSSSIFMYKELIFGSSTTDQLFGLWANMLNSKPDLYFLNLLTNGTSLTSS